MEREIERERERERREREEVLTVSIKNNASSGCSHFLFLSVNPMLDQNLPLETKQKRFIDYFYR